MKAKGIGRAGVGKGNRVDREVKVKGLGRAG